MCWYAFAFEVEEMRRCGELVSVGLLWILYLLVRCIGCVFRHGIVCE